MGEFRRINNVIKDMYEPFHEGESLWTDTTEANCENLVLPPWLCQPYVRACPEEHLKKMEENSNVKFQNFNRLSINFIIFRSRNPKDTMKTAKVTRSVESG